MMIHPCRSRSPLSRKSLSWSQLAGIKFAWISREDPSSSAGMDGGNRSGGALLPIFSFRSRPKGPCQAMGPGNKIYQH